MPKEEWGVKRLCPHCASRFYDLNNDPMTCPVCNNTFTLEALTSGSGRTLVTDKTASQKDEDVDLDDEDLDADSGDVDLDDDLLDDDDDDDNVSLDDIADVSTEDKEDN